MLLEKLLILALQVLLQDDAPDVDSVALVAKPGVILPIRGVQIRIVVEFALAVDAGVERLRRLIVPLGGVRIEQLAASLGERDASRVVTKIHCLDEPFVAQVTECLVVDVQVVFGHDAEGADSGEGAAVFAVQLVNAIAIHDRLALVATRQIEVPHQAATWIVGVPVPFVIHALATVLTPIMVPRVISRIEHGCPPDMALR